MKIVRNVIDIALQCPNHNVGTVFISSIVYSTKANYELFVQAE